MKDAAVVECSGNGTELRLGVVITYRRAVRVQMTTASKAAASTAKVAVSCYLPKTCGRTSLSLTLLPLWPIETQISSEGHSVLQLSYSHIPCSLLKIANQDKMSPTIPIKVEFTYASPTTNHKYHTTHD